MAIFKLSAFLFLCISKQFFIAFAFSPPLKYIFRKKENNKINSHMPYTQMKVSRLWQNSGHYSFFLYWNILKQFQTYSLHPSTLISISKNKAILISTYKTIITCNYIRLFLFIRYPAHSQLSLIFQNGFCNWLFTPLPRLSGTSLTEMTILLFI